MMILAFIQSVIAGTYIITSKITGNNFVIYKPYMKDYLNFIERDVVSIGNIGFSIIEADPYDIQNLLYHPNVLFIEEDKKIQIEKVQKNPVWNLDRIDQRQNKLNNLYFYDDLEGTGVNNYVIDTGVDISHEQLKPRATWGINFADKETEKGCIHPHGTHVAGIIGSKEYGVAKNTSIISVKVLDCNGSGMISSIIKGLGWVFKDKKDKKLINMSLGGQNSGAINKAIEELYNNGILTVSAAGNSNEDACNSSPASSDYTITVGSTDSYTSISSFSNWGKCVDIFAPGENILSSIPGNQKTYMSGTSMASPHVAGVLSLLISKNKLDIKKIREILINSSTPDTVSGNLKGSPDKFLFSLA